MEVYVQLKAWLYLFFISMGKHFDYGLLTYYRYTTLEETPRRSCKPEEQEDYWALFTSMVLLASLLIYHGWTESQHDTDGKPEGSRQDAEKCIQVNTSALREETSRSLNYKVHWRIATWSFIKAEIKWIWWMRHSSQKSQGDNIQNQVDKIFII